MGKYPKPKICILNFDSGEMIELEWKDSTEEMITYYREECAKQFDRGDMVSVDVYDRHHNYFDQTHHQVEEIITTICEKGKL